MNPSLRYQYRVKCGCGKILYLGEEVIGNSCQYWADGYCKFRGKCSFKVGEKV